MNIHLLPTSDVTPIFDFHYANIITNIVTIAVTDFKLFTVLSNTPLSVSEVGDKLAIHDRPAEAMLNACVALGLLKKSGDKYISSPLAKDYFVKGSPWYMGDLFELKKAGPVYEKLKMAILTNRSQIYKQGDTWDEHKEDQSKLMAFMNAMHALSIVPAGALAQLFDFSACNTILDIGGGAGTFTLMAALNYNHLKGIVLDMDEVCRGADKFIAENKLGDRVVTRGGDIFKDPFPEGADTIILSNILHDWDEEKCNSLLKRSYDYLPAGGRILINEALLDEDKKSPLFTTLFSLVMLIWTEGRQYTGGEITRMLERNGFSGVVIKPTAGYYSLITAAKQP